MGSIKLNDKIITSRKMTPYVIAEIGNNHNGRFDIAMQLIGEAKQAGADAVKFQKKDPCLYMTRDLYDKPYENKNSFGPTYGAHKEALELNEENFIKLYDYARSIKIDFFATPFDCKSLEFLERLDMPFYKIQSGDIDNYYFIKKICDTGKPIILSTGAAAFYEIENAVNFINTCGNPCAILHCTSLYPASSFDIFLPRITKLVEHFPENVIGFSNHYNGITACVGAYIYGAYIIEVHFTLDRASRGPDHASSLQPQGLKKLISYLKEIERMELYSEKSMEMVRKERINIRKFKKSLYAIKDIPEKSEINWENIAAQAPYDSEGMSIYVFYNRGEKSFKASRNIREGELLTLAMV